MAISSVAADDFQRGLQLVETARHGNEVGDPRHVSDGRIESFVGLDEILQTTNGHDRFDELLGFSRGGR